ncbi:MAG: SDR family NAD(P)-dependent oxidoreductase, partial [Bacilli bacterium]
MNALITGGTGGIGFFMAKELLKKGYDVFLISRNIGRTDELIKEFPDRKVYFFSHDLSREDECYHLLLEINNIPFKDFSVNL